MLRYGFIAIVWMFAAVWPGAARAFDWGRFADVDRDGWTCLAERLDSALLADLAVGIRPADEVARKSAEAAYGACSCSARPPVYEGVLFDALAFVGGEGDADAVLDEAAAMGVGKMAVGADAETLQYAYPDLVIPADGVRFRQLDDPEADAGGKPVIVSGREAGIMDRCGFLSKRWAEALGQGRKRFLFASGADPGLKGRRDYAETVRRIRRVLGQLPSAAADRVARENAEKLYGVVVIGP